MTLDEKRKVIEVLLCAAHYVDAAGQNRTTHHVASELGESPHGHISRAAADAWIACDDFWQSPIVDHGTVCLEAAYRLIESSPTLRREWFGAP